jgi:hypothetical protein
MLVPTPTTTIEGGPPLLRAERPSPGAVKAPSAPFDWTRVDLEELEEALYDLEMNRGDWAKSH